LPSARRRPRPGRRAGTPAAARTEIGDRLAPAISEQADAIAAIEIVTAGNGSADPEDAPVRLERDGDNWALASKAGFPAEADRVRQLVTGLSELRTVEPKTANADYYSRLGVQWPDETERDEGDFSTRPTLVRLLDDEGTPIAEVVLGETTFSGGESRRYARVLGEDQSWLVSGSVTIPFGPLGFVNTRFVELPRESVQSFKSYEALGPGITLERQSPEGDFTLVNAPEGAVMTNQALANNTGNALAFVNFADVGPLQNSVSRAPDSGFFWQFETFDGLTIKLESHPLGDPMDRTWFRVSAAGEGSESINQRFGNHSFTLPEGTVESLFRQMSDLTELSRPDAAPEEAGPALPDAPGLPPPADSPAGDG
jgi:hypothetical protein